MAKFDLNDIFDAAELLSFDDPDQRQFLFDFLEYTRQSNDKILWNPGTIFIYKERYYKLAHQVLARPQVNNPGCFAYEELADETYAQAVCPPENNPFGAISVIHVKNIHHTLQKNMLTGEITVEANQSQVKIFKEDMDIRKWYTKLYNIIPGICPPSGNYLVMSQMPGEPLNHYLASNVLTRQQKYALVFAILTAYDNQVIKKDILHNNMRPENIKVRYNEESKTFEADIINFENCDTRFLSSPRESPDRYLDYDNKLRSVIKTILGKSFKNLKNNGEIHNRQGLDSMLAQLKTLSTRENTPPRFKACFCFWKSNTKKALPAEAPVYSR